MDRHDGNLLERVSAGMVIRAVESDPIGNSRLK